MSTDTVELVTGLQGRWLGKRGIFRHSVPGIEDVDLNGDEGVHHVMVTSVAGSVVGWLIRWAWEPGEIDYEVRIKGLEEHAGLSDVAAYSIDTLADLAQFANNLRQEWELITGVRENHVWSVWPDMIDRLPE
ncbi:hypothetical protein [Mycobacterium sp. AZCC_0083]|uniref:hypothetical protein n=1 Tax=Mycobacterium sp. AZCC_0083 TaxID=2735882 RepID=UPI001620B850|nr:hypothetical protein [Mycobacterium sp. AZCC_0083]MBB5160754.1 hypothetical protein [Mycobacterium sp. AZCC_0083]